MSHLKNKMTRIAAVLLAILMVLTVAPIIAFPASAAEAATPYRIVHLDCGRKYFSVENIKKLIDTMAQYGYNQLQLAFGNDGCRFLLDDMSLSFGSVTMSSDDVRKNITNGNEYHNGDTRFLTQNDMDGIIAYADGKGIEIVPMLNMPGHATAIVYDTDYASGGNLNVNNETARNYGCALLKKYVDYFKGKGCKFFHFGSDESGYTGDNMTKFLTGCAKVITDAGMTPRAFNDATNVATMPTSVQITYWHQESGSKTASALANDGYQMINTHGRWYYVIKNAQNSEIGTKYWQGKVNSAPTSVELPVMKAEKMDKKWVGINEYFDGNPGYGSTISDSKGSMFCIWCDASQDSYLTDSDVISENVNYGALYQIEKLAEHYWPNDIKTKPQITLDNDSGVPASVVNGTKFTLKADRSVTWSVEPETGVILISSNSVFGTSVSLEAVGVGTATVTATDENKLTASYTIEVTADTTEATTKNVELKVGESKAFDVASDIVAGDKDTGNEYIATASVTEGVAQAAGYKAVTEITSGKKYLILNKRLNNLLTSTYNTDSGWTGLQLAGTPSATSTDWWEITQTNSGYIVAYNGDTSKYLTLGDNTSFTGTTPYNLTFTYNSDDEYWNISYNGYYLNNLGGSTIAGGWRDTTGQYDEPTDAGSKWTLYEITEASSGNSTLTITGTGEGDTSVTVGNVTYNIKVTAPTFTESKALTYGTSFSLPSGAEAQITSGENCVTLTENNTKITAGQTDGNATVEAVVKNAGGKVTARYTYNITVSSIDFDAIAPLPVQLWITNTWVGADSAPTSLQTVNVAAKSAYKEEGVLLSEFVPASGYKKDGSNTVRVTYWKGVALHNGIKPVQQGTDYSNSGDTFLRIRYWNGAWQYLNGIAWTSIVTDDTIVAYYLQLNNVSNEITTGTQHYGNPPTAHPGNTSGNGYNMTAFAVVYPDGTLSRTEQEMYETGMIRGFWGGTTTNIGTIYAENNSIYKISKITLTWGKNKLGASGDNWYVGNKTGTYGTDWGVEWEKETNSAGHDWYKETTYWKAGDSEIPMIDGETLGLNLTPEKNAALILIYLEVVQTEDTLSVIYWDDNADAQITTNPMPIPIVVDNGITFLKIKQSSTVHVGEFTLDDNAYIVNSSGANQGFNKEISTVPGVTGVYLSGMYKYSKAEISEDGKTLKLHFNLKNADNQKTYVVDFGLPLVIKASDFEITELHAISSVSLEKGRITTEQTGTFGTAIIANDWSKVTYRLNKILTGKATIPLYVTFTGGAVKLFNAHIIPASTVYYEDGFIEYTDGAWTTEGTKDANRTQGTHELGTAKGDNDIRYGYDSSYGSDATFSAGSAHVVTVTPASPYATAKFTFTGTGFDLVSVTDATTGVIFVQAVNQKTGEKHTWFVDTFYGVKQAEANKYIHYTWTKGTDNMWHVKREYVEELPSGVKAGTKINVTDTSYEIYEYNWEIDNKGTLYQIPVMSKTVDYGTYDVTVKVVYSGAFDHSEAGRYKFYIDGVRIYNTLGETYADYEKDGENNPTFNEVRDILIGGNDFGEITADTTITKPGTVFIDGLNETGSVDDFKKYGPNNEVYLKPGQAIAFKVAGNAKLFIGAKAPAEEVTMVINGKSVKISTATDMYYPIEAVNGKVVIANDVNSVAILSITTIKATGVEATYSVDSEVVAYARAMLLEMIQPPVFTPELIEASWTTVKLFRRSVHTLTVRTSADVDHITVDGKEITDFYYSVTLVGSGWNRKLVKCKMFTVTYGNDARLGDYDIVAFNAEGVASEPHKSTLTGKPGVGKFN